MSWLQRIKSAWKALTMDEFAEQLRSRHGGLTSTAGPYVSATSALKIATVYSCARLLSETIATLPLFVMEKKERGREKASSHPLFELLRIRPNPEMTAVEVRGAQMMNLLFRGRSYNRLVRNGRGVVREIWPLQADDVTERRPRRNGPRVFDWKDPETGMVTTLGESDMWRINGLSFNGVQGLDPLTFARDTYGTALAREQYAAAMFKNGGRPSGVIEQERPMKDDEYFRFKESWQQEYGSAPNTGKTPILEMGMKYKPISMTLENAQWIEGARFSVAEICRIFRVPLHMVYDHDTQPRANMEQSSLEFVVHSLRVWLVMIEQSAHRDLLFEPERKRFFILHRVDGLLRGDFKTRQEGYRIGRDGGWLNGNDIRELDDLNAVDGLDDYWRPKNMAVVGEPEEEPTPPPAPPPPADPAAAPAEGSEPKPTARERKLLEGAAHRAVKRELGQLRGAAKKGADAEALRSVLDRHTEYLEEALACSPEAARAYADRRYVEILNLCAAPEDELEPALQRWEDTLPARILREVAHAAPIR